MEQVNQLRGAVVGKFGSMERLAQEIGWSGRKTRDVVSGRQTMTIADIEKLSDALQVRGADEFMRLFFPRLSI